VKISTLKRSVSVQAASAVLFRSFYLDTQVELSGKDSKISLTSAVVSSNANSFLS
jgi:hypothetical protein